MDELVGTKWIQDYIASTTGFTPRLYTIRTLMSRRGMEPTIEYVANARNKFRLKYNKADTIKVLTDQPFVSGTVYRKVKDTITAPESGDGKIYGKIRKYDCIHYMECLDNDTIRKPRIKMRCNDKECIKYKRGYDTFTT